MPRILDHSQAQGVADAVLDLQNECGYTDEEFIPGLIQAVIMLANNHSDAFDQILDEAATILADGSV